MNHQNLRELLTQLHARLGATTTLSSDERERLTTVLHDIEKVLARRDEPASPPKPRLEAFAVRFDADHPALAASLRQLVDLLGKAGI